MKRLFYIIVFGLNFLFVTQTQAATCEVILENARGRVIESFRGYGYNNREACRDAKRFCRRAIRAGYFRARNLSCRVIRPNRDNRSPRYNRNQCVGVNTFGKWAQGGGCNTFGCWYSGGSCNTFGCLSEAPKTRQACEN